MLELDQRVQVLTAVVRLLLALIKISGFQLDRSRLPDAATKRVILTAVAGARRALSLRAALRVLKLSQARYHAWAASEQSCALDDRPSCPRSVPQRLTFFEVSTIGELVRSTQFRHMSVRALALHAQRAGTAVAHPNTWAKLIRERGWRRPRLRLYPAKPKLGFRASRPNQAWHIDVTILKLLHGTKAFVHAVIDNYSRKILACSIAEKLNPRNTCHVLVEAGAHLDKPTSADVFMDSGIENLNRRVDPLFDTSALQRVIAQIDIAYSNSMIEAWFRALKHNCLFLHQLSDFVTGKRLVTFYVGEHNTTIAHSAFDGETPDEIYFGTGGHVAQELATRRLKARRSRIERNRSVACGACPLKWTPHFGPQVKVEPARTREQDNDEKSTGETQFSI